MQNDMNTLILCSSLTWFKGLRDLGYSVELIYKPLPFMFRALRKIHFHLKWPFCSLWYGKWRRQIQNYQNIILLDSIFNAEILVWIRKRNPLCKLIFWHINLVNTITHPDNYPADICVPWSFDKGDCEKYGFHYCPSSSFYSDEFKLPDAQVEHDIFFLGVDKNRLNALCEFKTACMRMGLNSFFYVVKDKCKKYKSNDMLKSRHMPYNDNLLNIAKSKAILDFVRDDQLGLTLRVMESIFYGKKLITNNKSVADFDLYNPKNIFILGVDDMDSLPEFIHSEYEPVETSILEKYKLKNVIGYILEHTIDFADK